MPAKRASRLVPPAASMHGIKPNPNLSHASGPCKLLACRSSATTFTAHICQLKNSSSISFEAHGLGGVPNQALHCVQYPGCTILCPVPALLNRTTRRGSGWHGHKTEELYAGGVFASGASLGSTCISKSDQHAGLDTLSPLHSAKPHELEDIPSL